MVASGTIPAAPASIVQTLTGLVQVTPTPVVTATLLVVTNIQGGPASAYIISGSITGSTTAGVAPYNYGGTFTTVISDPPSDTNYTWSVGPTIVQASGIINGSQTVVTTITGTLQLT